MTTTENTTEYLVTSCPDHGVKVCSDRASFIAYVEMSLACDHGYRWSADGSINSLSHHDHFHAETGTDCWRCCGQMVIDPYGELDY
jgi:hypothetical protein